MAVNMSRSMNAELQEGSVDGTYKKIPANTSNVGNPMDERREMSWRYGFEDAPTKFRPDAGHQIARRNSADHG